ncbi:hypothetical protein M405DRAFT_880738 [Rhizopogon salebrosus TDB-379]|nr:hypothetical protein M405DRAFT_880738 [Rhizopogon salebrosus TDB-379]
MFNALLLQGLVQRNGNDHPVTQGPKSLIPDIPAPLTTTYTASVEATPHIAPPAQEETRPSTTSSSTARNTYENDTFVNALRRKATSISYTLTSDDAIQPPMRYINSTGHWYDKTAPHPYCNHTTPHYIEGNGTRWTRAIVRTESTKSTRRGMGSQH